MWDLANGEQSWEVRKGEAGVRGTPADNAGGG